MKALILAVGCAAALLAGSAARAELERVKTAEARTAISVADRSGLLTASLKKFRIKVAPGKKAGTMHRGWLCGASQPIAWDKQLVTAVTQPIARAFRREMNRAGYPAPASKDSAFETKPAVSADLDMAATLSQLDIRACNHGDGEFAGGLWLQVRWEVFSPKLQKVVLDVTTEGSYWDEDPKKISIVQMLDKAYGVAAGNLLAEPRFVEAMSGARAGAAAQAVRLRIRSGREPSGGMAKNATLLRSAVVTLDSGRGTGSGFFIGREGYLLTNQHVVRDAKFLKVKLATGRELVGEVLQTNARRDVALVKTESAGAEPLAIRATEPNIGEDVYAIGSPYGERFSGTLTRGVLSGHRTLDALRFLQSDVAVLPGNSGGPLLDADGRVVGIAVRALDAGRANLNLFIPIQEALDVLAVDIIP